MLRCPATVRLPLAKVLRKYSGDPVDGFEVAGKIESPERLKSQWLRVILGNGQAYGYRIEGIEPQGQAARITIADEPGFELTGKGARLLFNPFYETDGPCRVEIARSAFKRV